jgi:hypothetical protein
MKNPSLVLLCLIALAWFALASGNPISLGGRGAAAKPAIHYSKCTPGGGGIPCRFWGIHVHNLTSYPVLVPYGQFRTWDGADASWPAIAAICNPSSPPTDSCFAWDKLDEELTKVKAAGVDDVFFTLSRTPPWAVTQQQQTDADCNYYDLGPDYYGACYPPIDVLWDGTGTDQIWKNWVAAIALHVNQKGYAGAHIKYWEIWNEIYRSPTLQKAPPPYSFGGQYDQTTEGSYDQLVRMAEDANCIITGRVTHIIENHEESCAAVLQTVGLTKPIDPTAVIVSPSTSAPAATTILANFLYCNSRPRQSCTHGDAGFKAVDIIDAHLYAGTMTPEFVVTSPQQLHAVFAIAGGKPVWNGEGSWGDTAPAPGKNLWHDAFAQAGFIPRFFALYWSAGVTGNFWYGYDYLDEGELFNPSMTTVSPLLRPQADAWTHTYNWLAHAVPLHKPFCQANGTIYHCDFIEGPTSHRPGHLARLVWDSRYGEKCSEMRVPIICGDTRYNVPAQFDEDWLDLRGTMHGLAQGAANVVTIGANPILLEGR